MFMRAWTGIIFYILVSYFILFLLLCISRLIEIFLLRAGLYIVKLLTVYVHTCTWDVIPMHIWLFLYSYYYFFFIFFFFFICLFGIG